MRRVRVFFFLFILFVVSIVPSIAFADVEIIGSWIAGTTHSEEAGTDRALVFNVHVETNNSSTDIGSVTYGGQSMTEVVDKIFTQGLSAYTAAFILDESGISAASGSSFAVSWNVAPSGTPAFASAFLQDVNQSSLTGATGTGGGTTTTVETPALSTSNGDMAIVAGTNGNTGNYSTINGFTEAIETAPSSADGIVGYLSSTGGDVTPGISHDNVNRQSVIGFVVNALSSSGSSGYNVKNYGATGDGSTSDTAAINAAIAAADANGGGTVYFPTGTYKSGSLIIKDNITLDISANATLLATNAAEYSIVDDNPWDEYQDWGHSHWKSSLIWGIGVNNVAVTGTGLINGEAMTAGDPSDGYGDRVISFKDCNGILVEDISIYRGGHFCIITSGCNDITIDNVLMDTNRDGINIDCCNDVNIVNCIVNSPKDDAICMKSSYCLGYKRPTENVTISKCTVMGHAVGYLLFPPGSDEGWNAGRIKFGTESNGGFKNITITDCNFMYCRGFMLATVDGGDIDNIIIDNIQMTELWCAPIFMRLGDRARGPGPPPPGTYRNVNISNINATFNATYVGNISSIISGIPGHCVEDVNFSYINVVYPGGGPAAWADIMLEENEIGYPDAFMFGLVTPSYGFYVRHAKGIELHDCDFSFDTNDERPAFVLIDVNGFELDNVDAERYYTSGDHIKFDDVDNLNIHDCPDFPPTTATYGSIESTKEKVVVGEEFNIVVPAISGSTGICTTDMDVDSSLFDTRYDWLNAGVQKDVNFSDVQMYTPGERLVEISSSSLIQGVCMKEDFNLDFIVDYCDLDVMAQNWLSQIQQLLPSGDPVAHWKFDEPNGSTAWDSSANSNNGTLHNMDDSDWIAGKYGNALDFDGSDDYIRVEDHSSMSFGTGPFSVTFWIKQPVYNGGMILINGSSNDPPSGNRYEIGSTSSYGGDTVGAVVFVIDSDDGGGKRVTNSGTTFVSDEWIHCACIHNTSTQRIYIYKNGDEVSSSSAGTGDINSPDEPLYIAQNELGADRFDGMLDDIRLYDYALSEEEIETLLDVVYPSFPVNLYEDGNGIIDLKDFAVFAQSWLVDVQ